MVMMQRIFLAAASLLSTAAAADMTPVEYSHMGDALLGFKTVPDEPKAEKNPAVVVVP